MQDYRNLEVWQVSMDYVVNIYKLAASFPHDERHDPASQIRRAATSIPLNIAEGAGCDSNREFTRYLVYAYSSCNELQGLIIDGNRLCKMLYSFIKKLKTINPKP